MKKMKLAALMIGVLVASGFANCTKAGNNADAQAAAQESKYDPAAADMEEPSNVLVPENDSVFRPGMKVAEPTLIDFNATWCGPCRMLTPAFDLAAASYSGKVKFYSVDVDKFPATATAFQVRSIPYLMLMLPDGRVQQYVGLGDFVEGLDPAKEPSQEELTNVMYGNLSKILDAAIAK